MNSGKAPKKLLRTIGILVLAVCMLVSLAATAYADLADVQADADSVLQMNFGVKNDVGKEYKLPYGTCFLINEDTVITCYHVIDPNYMYEIFDSFYGTEIYGQLSREQIVEKINNSVTYSVTVTRDVTISATLLNGSESMDFAILKLSQPIKGRHHISLRSSKDVKAAEAVYALGFPAISDVSHEVSTYTKDDVTYSSGVVSKPQDLYTFDFMDGSTLKGQFLQTTCEINSGNSGGPMVDENGNCVAVASVSQSDSFYYGVAIDQVIEVLDALGIDYTRAGEAPAVQDEPQSTETAAPEQEPAEAPAAVDTAALDSAISQAAAIEEKEYTKESYDALWTALTNARNAKNAETQAEVDTALNELNRAVNNLEPAAKGSNMLYIIIAAVAAVIVIVVVVLLVSSNKNKKEKEAAAAAEAAKREAEARKATVGGTSGFTAPPVTPAGPVGPTSTPISNTGETTILRGSLEATTVLANGGTLTRVKNGDKLEIKVQEILVGRDGKVCNFLITGNTNIGRRHAKFVVKNGTTYVVDCNSTNGTFVNGTKLQPNVETALKDGDRVTLADEDFKYSK